MGMHIGHKSYDYTIYIKQLYAQLLMPDGTKATTN